MGLDKWFESVDVQPNLIGQFEDLALLNVFGQRGSGFFAGYDVIESEISRVYGVESIGAVAHREQFYAITVERRISHPAVATITQSARAKLFGK